MEQKTFTSTDMMAIFPEAKEIKDSELRQKTLNALADAYNEGGWTKDNYTLCPVSLKVKNPILRDNIRHVRAVTRNATFAYDTLVEVFEQKPDKRDIVVCGALLHDLGKCTEFTVNEKGENSLSKEACFLRHPLNGAIIAAKAGLPAEVVHMIATHSFEGKDSYKTPEQQLVKMSDEIAFNYVVGKDS